MNYIRHLNSVFLKFSRDTRLNPTHISLYFSLFQIWNRNRFPDKFQVNREELMVMAKIGSKSTYHRCIKDLNAWNYIDYFPSHNIYHGSQVTMLILGTTNETTSDLPVVQPPGQPLGQPLVHNINIKKHKINNYKLGAPPTKKAVLKYFKLKNWPGIEGEKFFHHYQSTGWKIGGRICIVDWQSTAKSWMLKANELQRKHGEFRNQDNLKTTKNKNYDEPL